MSQEVREFKLSIPQADQHRLRSQLLDAQEPKQEIVVDAGYDYGIPHSWAQQLLQRYREDYSWPATQQKINNVLSQYTTELEGLNIHFIHQRSSFPDAIPLLLIHGWPGSFYEFSEAIPLLTNHPGDGNRNTKSSTSKRQSQQTFHCVAPSLPGFTFSSAPKNRGWTVKDTARIFHALMQRLGYHMYAVQAGDWGQFVARELGANAAYNEACRVIHLNYCPGSLPEELSEADLSSRERGARERGIGWRTQHVGYAVLMRTRPQTLDYMLRDNPVGLVGFVGEKYSEAAAPEVQGEGWWLDHVLTTVSLYYFTRCIGSSGLIYYENVPHHEFARYAMREENRIKCPFGYTSYWYDTAPNSRRAVERTGKLVFYKERDYAGHFAALEDPVGLSSDIREVVASHWNK